MRNSEFYPNLKCALKMLMAVVFCSFQFNNSDAQGLRSYATREAINIASPSTGSVSNAGYANDNNPATASTLTQSASLSSSAYTEQILDFDPNPSSNTSYTATIAPNTPITVKIELPSSVLAVVDKIEIQAITGLAKSGSNWTYTNVGTALTGTALLSLLSGQGSSEVTLTPNAAFQGIRVRVNKPLLLSNTAGVYHAYIKVPAAGNAVCNQRIDVLSGAKPVALTGGLLSATSSVSNPWNAIDTSLTTYAQLSTGVDVLNVVYHLTIFNSTSKVGDSLKIRMRDNNGTPISIGALTGFKIKLYNGNSLIQTIINDPALLNLTLLDPVNNIVQLSTVPNIVFDKVEIGIGGVVNAFSNIRVYDVSRKNAGVSFTSSGQGHNYVYAGQPYTLSAMAIAAGDSVVFYDAPTNGNVVPGGMHATTMRPNDTVLLFYAGAVRGGCMESSERKLTDVHIVGFVRDLPVTGYVGQMYNSDIIILADTNNLPAPSHIHYVTTDSLPAGLSLDMHTGLITGMPTTAESVSFMVAAMDEANNLPVGNFSYTMFIQPNIALSKDFELAYKVVKDQVILNWVTHTENLNDRFDIERSMDGSKFNVIGTIKSKYERGTGTGEMTYDFTDKSPRAGINYYRLKQTDLNGKAFNSNIVSAFVGLSQAIVIYPNPVKGFLNIQGENLKAVYIYNSVGRLVLSKLDVKRTNMIIDVRTFSNGIYSAKVEYEAGSSVKKFVVNQ